MICTNLLWNIDRGLATLFCQWFWKRAAMIGRGNSLSCRRSTKMKKSARRRKHCPLAVVRRSQKFRPAADPLPGGAGPPKFNQLEMVDARNFELSW